MSAAKSGAYTQCHRAGQPCYIVRSPLFQVANFRPLSGPVPLILAPGPSTSRTLRRPARGLTVAHARRKWYAIFEPAAARGVYRFWEHVKHFVTGQSNAVHKGFASEAAALEWISHLTLRSQEEEHALEQLRQTILGPDYRVGQPAALAPSPGHHLSPSSSSRPSDISPAGGSAVGPTAVPTSLTSPNPRPWETPPIVLPVPAAPSREYYRKWYAVRFVDGGSPAVYNTWQETEAAINGRYAEHRSFDSQAEALVYAFGRAYVEQLLQDEQLRQQLQPGCQAQFVADAAGPGYCASPSGVSNGAAAEPLSDQPYQPYEYETYSEQTYCHIEHDQHSLRDVRVGNNEGIDTRGASSDVWSFADLAAEVVSRMQGVPASLTNLRTTALAAYDAAASRPTPVNPGGGLAASAERRPPEVPSAAGLGWPLPAPTAMTAPLSYAAPYGCPAPAMVLTAAVAPVCTPGQGRSASGSLGHWFQHPHKQQRQKQQPLAASGEVQLEVAEEQPVSAPCPPGSASCTLSSAPPTLTTTTWSRQAGLLAGEASGRSVTSSAPAACSASGTYAVSSGSFYSVGLLSSCRHETHAGAGPRGRLSSRIGPPVALGYDDRGAHDPDETEQPAGTDAIRGFDSGNQRGPNLLEPDAEPDADHIRRPGLAAAKSLEAASAAQAPCAHTLNDVLSVGTPSASQPQQADGSTEEPSRRRRGRPRKVVTATMAMAAIAAISPVLSTPPCAVMEASGDCSVGAAEAGSGAPAKRRRGRPPKNVAAADASGEAKPVPLAVPKRPRGRPRKVAAANV